MDAVVLVGGSGTRLRPLTLRTPKPMLPLVDRPLLAYLFDQLAAAGVTRAILACGYLPDALVAHFGDGGASSSGIALEYVVESEPLGTAGAARLAASGRVSETFLLLNGDILSEHDLGALVALHRARRGHGDALARAGGRSVALRRRRARSRRHGAALRREARAGESESDLVNAGAYVLEPAVLDAIPADRAVSIEREIFPALVGHGLAALPLEGYWSDVGTPESYLAAHVRLLGHGLGGRPGPHGVDPSAVIEEGAQLYAPRRSSAPGRSCARARRWGRSRASATARRWAAAASSSARSCRPARGWGRARGTRHRDRAWLRGAGRQRAARRLDSRPPIDSASWQPAPSLPGGTTSAIWHSPRRVCAASSGRTGRCRCSRPSAIASSARVRCAAGASPPACT